MPWVGEIKQTKNPANLKSSTSKSMAENHVEFFPLLLSK